MSKEIKHTPGPWKLQSFATISEQWIFSLCNPNPVGDIICRAPERGQTESLKQWGANAKLIAAAPDLLEALDECEAYFDNIADADHDETIPIPNREMKLLTIVRNAIKKAKQ